MNIKSINAVVTGGSSGLGEACVSELLRRGASCAVFDQKENLKCRTKNYLKKKLFFLKTDVSNEKNVKESINNAVDIFGSIHVLINCAGVGFSAKILDPDDVKKTTYMENFNRTIQVNLVGSMNVIKSSAEKMLDNLSNENNERGVIINTSSIAAFEGQIGQAAYSASKAGLIGMMLPLAREFANYGIRILTISPGLFDTPMFNALPEKIKTLLIAQIPFPKRLAFPLEYAKFAMHIIENPILNGETIRLDSAIRM